MTDRIRVVENDPVGMRKAIQQLSTRSISDAASLAAHLADSADAHAASAITNTPAGSIAATTVQAAIDELDAEKQSLDADLTALAAITCTRGYLITGQGATPAWAGLAIAVPASTFRKYLGAAYADTEPGYKDLFDATVPGTIAESDAAAAGTAEVAARRDHTHGAPATWTPSAHNHDATYQPLDADLTAIAALSSADSNFIVGSAGGWVTESGATVRTSLGLGTANGPQFAGLGIGAAGAGGAIVTAANTHIKIGNAYVSAGTPGGYIDLVSTGGVNYIQSWDGTVGPPYLSNNLVICGKYSASLTQLTLSATSILFTGAFTDGFGRFHVGAAGVGSIFGTTDNTVSLMTFGAANIVNAGGQLNFYGGKHTSYPGYCIFKHGCYNGTPDTPASRIEFRYEYVSAGSQSRIDAYFDASGNFVFGLGTSAPGTSAAKVIAVGDGTQPAKVANAFQLLSLAAFPTFVCGDAGSTVCTLNQNLSTTASPTFAALTLTAELAVADGGTGRSDNKALVRAWVNFAGRGTDGNCTVNASFNISAGADAVVRGVGAGLYCINFDPAMTDANYVITGMGVTGSWGYPCVYSTPTATYCYVYFIDFAGNYVDPGTVHLAFFGN